MQYGLDKEDQSVKRRIWALYHPPGGTREGDTEDTAIMELGAITAEKDCKRNMELTTNSKGIQTNCSSPTQTTKW